ncbi:hypothetical protein HDU79_006832 [Rhizoclosmatium sp. JEL0117]|nr:hypothetical protein HDU79_006832 [Rhizoclosmatium sp. JEL0117]
MHIDGDEAGFDDTMPDEPDNEPEIEEEFDIEAELAELGPEFIRNFGSILSSFDPVPSVAEPKTWHDKRANHLSDCDAVVPLLIPAVACLETLDLLAPGRCCSIDGCAEPPCPACIGGDDVQGPAAFTMDGFESASKKSVERGGGTSHGTHGFTDVYFKTPTVPDVVANRAASKVSGSGGKGSRVGTQIGCDAVHKAGAESVTKSTGKDVDMIVHVDCAAHSIVHRVYDVKGGERLWYADDVLHWGVTEFVKRGFILGYDVACKELSHLFSPMHIDGDEAGFDDTMPDEPDNEPEIEEEFDIEAELAELGPEFIRNFGSILSSFDPVPSVAEPKTWHDKRANHLSDCDAVVPLLIPAVACLETLDLLAPGRCCSIDGCAEPPCPACIGGDDVQGPAAFTMDGFESASKKSVERGGGTSHGTHGFTDVYFKTPTVPDVVANRAASKVSGSGGKGSRVGTQIGCDAVHKAGAESVTKSTGKDVDMIVHVDCAAHSIVHRVYDVKGGERLWYADDVLHWGVTEFVKRGFILGYDVACKELSHLFSPMHIDGDEAGFDDTMPDEPDNEPEIEEEFDIEAELAELGPEFIRNFGSILSSFDPVPSVAEPKTWHDKRANHLSDCDAVVPLLIPAVACLETLDLLAPGRCCSIDGCAEPPCPACIGGDDVQGPAAFTMDGFESASKKSVERGGGTSHGTHGFTDVYFKTPTVRDVVANRAASKVSGSGGKGSRVGTQIGCDAVHKAGAESVTKSTGKDVDMIVHVDCAAHSIVHRVYDVKGGERLWYADDVLNWGVTEFVKRGFILGYDVACKELSHLFNACVRTWQRLSVFV